MLLTNGQSANTIHECVALSSTSNGHNRVYTVEREGKASMRSVVNQINQIQKLDSIMSVTQ